MILFKYCCKNYAVRETPRVITKNVFTFLGKEFNCNNFRIESQNTEKVQKAAFLRITLAYRLLSV